MSTRHDINILFCLVCSIQCSVLFNSLCCCSCYGGVVEYICNLGATETAAAVAYACCTFIAFQLLNALKI